MFSCPALFRFSLQYAFILVVFWRSSNVVRLWIICHVNEKEHPFLFLLITIYGLLVCIVKHHKILTEVRCVHTNQWSQLSKLQIYHCRYWPTDISKIYIQCMLIPYIFMPYLPLFLNFYDRICIFTNITFQCVCLVITICHALVVCSMDIAIIPRPLSYSTQPLMGVGVCLYQLVWHGQSLDHKDVYLVIVFAFGSLNLLLRAFYVLSYCIRLIMAYLIFDLLEIPFWILWLRLLLNKFSYFFHVHGHIIMKPSLVSRYLWRPILAMLWDSWINSL